MIEFCRKLEVNKSQHGRSVCQNIQKNTEVLLLWIIKKRHLFVKELILFMECLMFFMYLLFISLPKPHIFQSHYLWITPHRRACGFQNLVWALVQGGHNLPSLVEIGLRWLPKLGVDTSPRPHAHRRALRRHILQGSGAQGHRIWKGRLCMPTRARTTRILVCSS